MASALKPEDLNTFHQSLLSLRARLRGDLDQMTDEALKGGPDGAGNLSNMPMHMADVGSENYEQEFALELIENEQLTLDQVHEALARVQAGTYGKCLECDGLIAKPRLQALPYTPYCIECARKMENA